MNNNWRMMLWNELLELILMSGSDLGLSETQSERLSELYKGLTDYGREQIDIWAEDNNRSDFKAKFNLN